MRRTVAPLGFAFLVVFAAACLSGGPGELNRNFGQADLATLDTQCEGFPGLTGQALIDLQQDHLGGTLSYVTAQGQTVDPTGVTIDLTWPATPVATCYPAYSADGGVSAQPRLAINGVTMRFVTADGKFDETIASKAWLITVNGNHSPHVLGVSDRTALNGSWVPFPEYEGPATTMLFNVQLGGAAGQAGGNVGLSGEDPGELNAGILRSRFAIALF